MHLPGHYKKNHFYINGAQAQIECFTDHESLVNIENKDLAEVTNNRELKLLESITPYNIKVKHIPAANFSQKQTPHHLHT